MALCAPNAVSNGCVLATRRTILTCQDSSPCRYI